MAPIILKLGTTRQVASYNLWRKAEIPTAYVAEWASEHIWMLWRRKKKFLLLPRIQTPDHLACGLVTILTMISQLPIRKTNNEKIIEG